MFVAGLEFLLGMYEKYFHPNHSLLLTIKRHLIYIYGRYRDHCLLCIPRYIPRYADYCEPEMLAAKLNYCDQLLAVLDILMPGLTRLGHVISCY